jgi:hypothetical protein
MDVCVGLLRLGKCLRVHIAAARAAYCNISWNMVPPHSTAAAALAATFLWMLLLLLMLPRVYDAFCGLAQLQVPGASCQVKVLRVCGVLSLFSRPDLGR